MYFIEKKFFLIISAILCAYIVATLLFPFISPDVGFYLKIAYDLAEGISYYKDIDVAYTPLGMYFLSFAFKLNPDSGIRVMLIYYFIFYLIDAFLLYRILSYFYIKKQLKKQVLLLFIISLFILEGTNILLEPFVLLFQFVALILLFQWKLKKHRLKLLLSGISIFLAFFSKQYGLFIIPAFFYFIVVNSKKTQEVVFNLLSFATGLLIPTMALFVYFYYEIGLGAVETTYQLLGIQFITGEEVITGITYTFSRFLESLLNFILKTPYVIIPFFILLKKREQSQKLSTKSFFIILIISGGFVQLYFAAYYHYYQLIVPYFLLLIANLYAENEAKVLALLKPAFKITKTIFVFTSLVWLTVDVNNLVHRYTVQKKNVDILNNCLERNSDIYLEGISAAYYYLCLYNSPNYKKLGYKFPSELSLQSIHDYIPSNSYIIASSELAQNKLFKMDFRKLDTITLADDIEVIVLQKK